MIEYLVVFLWGFVPASLWIGYHFIYIDMWKERWNGKFRGTAEDFENPDQVRFHETDLEAFLWNFVDDSTPTVIWWRVIATPFISGAVISLLWWFIYATVQVAT